jgi:methyltransferase (TIGR00027 family)
VAMNRKEGDTWDLATSVGATATMVAAARAAASRRPASIINDPFAEPLVRATGVDFFARLARGELDFANVGGQIGTGWMPEVFAVRAKFFDRFFASAGAKGIRQAVIVAAGLDSRSYRLSWPDQTTIYEVDQPAVVEFKRRTLAALGAVPTAELHEVGVDLRSDWPAVLRRCGFDPNRATAWIAEGLLIGYLPGEAQEQLLDEITAMSAPGSELAVDHLPSGAEALGPQMAEITGQWKAHGFDSDVGNLTYAGQRSDVDTYLAQHGWDVTGYNLTDLFVGSGLGIPGPEALAGLTRDLRYLHAIRV